jgi:hypothetical protein
MAQRQTTPVCGDAKAQGALRGRDGGTSGWLTAGQAGTPLARTCGCRQRVPARTTACRATVDQVRTNQTGGDQCPACGECDLRPYGNDSKWACPRCHFILPCCEGGEVAGLPQPAGAAVH